MKRFLFGVATLTLVSVGCSPTIHVMDRHTVLEDEAAGEWPDFDQRVKTGGTEPLPVQFPKTAVSNRKKRLYNVLDGEFTPETKKTK